MNTIQKINQTPIEDLKLQDYANLKCGKDKYSSLRGEELWAACSTADARIIQSNIFDLGEADKALRWYLRGLEIMRAIGKVKADAQTNWCL